MFHLAEDPSVLAGDNLKQICPYETPTMWILAVCRSASRSDQVDVGFSALQTIRYWVLNRLPLFLLSTGPRSQRSFCFPFMSRIIFSLEMILVLMISLLMGLTLFAHFLNSRQIPTTCSFASFDQWEIRCFLSCYSSHFSIWWQVFFSEETTGFYPTQQTMKNAFVFIYFFYFMG